MCGIAGIVDTTANLVSRETVEKMTSALVHRGPDASGYHVRENIGLGHRRLAIIDLSTGDQPMYSTSRDVVIVFNGEIYNYLELRNELQGLGRTFGTDSDTEVALQAYEEWGVNCQQRFNGMWAFAIWDGDRQELFLSRDRCGEKPLHYAVHKGRFLFGSEAKSLLAGGVPAERNLEMLEIYLTFGYIPAPHSFYRYISKLQPGHYLVVRNGKVAVREYWSLPQVPESEMCSDRDVVEQEFSHLLEDSVRIRMRCDVPYGAFLSGGLDSTSIVSIMSGISDFPIETFTIGFDEKDYDERPLARTVADRFHTRHHEFSVAREEFDQALAATLHHFDEPFGDSSAIPTGYVSASAGRHVKMVLTGDGGDEVLSGYESYAGEKVAAIYQKLPAPVQKGIPGVVRTTGALLGGNARYRLNRLSGALQSSGMSFEDRLIFKSAWLAPALIGALMEDCGQQYSAADYVSDVLGQCSYRDPFYRLMYFQFRVTLPERMLTKVDRMSMAHSLEARVPFLDHRLVELMAGVSKQVKMPGFTRKAVLKHTVGRRLPEALHRAPKRGFRIPLREWFKDAAFSRRFSRVAGSGSCLKQEAIDRLFEENRSGRQDLGNFLWMLFLLDGWLRQG